MTGWIPCPAANCLDGAAAWREPGGGIRVEICPTCDGRLWIRDRRSAGIRWRPVPVALLATLAVFLVCVGFLAGRVA